jgi:hypothetical protein
VELADSARASLISALPSVLRAENPTLDPHIKTFISFQRDIVKMGHEVSPKAALVEAAADAARENVRQIIAVTSKLTDDLDRRAQIAASQAGELAQALRLRVIATALLLPLGGAMLAVYLLRTHLTRPLRELMAAIGAATDSSRVIEVPHRRRHDEIGQLARLVRTLSEVRATLVTREAGADRRSARRDRRRQRSAARGAAGFGRQGPAGLRQRGDCGILRHRRGPGGAPQQRCRAAAGACDRADQR